MNVCSGKKIIIKILKVIYIQYNNIYECVFQEKDNYKNFESNLYSYRSIVVKILIDSILAICNFC